MDKKDDVKQIKCYSLIKLLNDTLWTISSRYRYDWQKEEAAKNLLRTHTTAVSARMLYALAQQVSVNMHLVLFIFDSFQDSKDD